MTRGEYHAAWVYARVYVLTPVRRWELMLPPASTRSRCVNVEKLVSNTASQLLQGMCQGSRWLVR